MKNKNPNRALMIGLNSMIDDNQEIDLSLRRLENISIVKKVII